MKIILNLITLLLLSSICHAQQMAPEDIPTPNATSLGRYGDIPVSYYTGQPNISIPLYTMNVRGFEFPITLQHDAGGLMVNSLPSWTGHNWTLNAGGVITRERNYACDEYKPVTQSTLMPFSNYFSSYSKLKEHQNNDDSLEHNTLFYRYDYQPDIFTFSFLGKTGKFFLGNDGQWKVSSDYNIDVVFDINNDSNYILPFIDFFPTNYYRKQPKVIKGFTLRDEKGYVYEFGGSNDAIDYSTSFYKQTEHEKDEGFLASSWYLTKIKDKYDNVLYELEYERGAFIAQFYNIAYAYYLNEQAGGDEFLFPEYGQEVFQHNYLFPYDGVLNSPVYLTKIKTLHDIELNFYSEYSSKTIADLYPNLDVYGLYDALEIDYSNTTMFYYLQTDNEKITKYQYPCRNQENLLKPLKAACLKELKEIRIGYVNSPTMRVIDLSYSNSSRMHLKSIRFFNSNKSISYAKYDLNYKNYEYLPTDYLSTATDHWGFYNASPYGHPYTNVGATRQPNHVACQYGLLKEIIYPTGGKSVFTYEPHDYSSSVSEHRTFMINNSGTAGGVRIKSITEYSDTEETEILRKREFTYKNPLTNSSSGELFSRPMYDWNNWAANIYDENGYSNLSLFRTTSIIPLSNSFGPHIGYTYVEEKEINGTFKRYKYINISEAMDERFIKDFSNGEPSPYDMFTERGYKRGKLLSISTFDSDNQLLSKIKYGYIKGNVETDSVLTCNLVYHQSNVSGSFSYISGGIYKLLFPKYDVVADTTILYRSATDSVVDYKEYEKENILLSTSYGYPHYVMARILKSEKHSRCNSSYYDEYEYPFNSPTEAIYKLYHDQFDLQPITEKRYVNNNLLNGNIKNFRLSEEGKPVLDSYMRINSNNSKDTIAWYYTYTPRYSIKTYRQIGKPLTKIDWASNETFISGITYGVDATGMDTHHATFYEFSPLEGLTDIFFPNNYRKSFYYDGFDRLFEIVENYDYPIQRFRYNVKNK